MFEAVITVIFVLYFIFLFLFTTGLRKKFNRNSDYLPFVSVIVCARNEEKNILSCLESLNKINYPSDKLEIIIVDDDSNDSTGALIVQFIADKNVFRMIKTSPSEKLKGKINALTAGINNSSGEIIILTDADCSVQPDWVKTFASYYTKQTAMVCGFTSLSGESIFSQIQQIDLTFLLSIASGTANINKPVSCIGNNISFRKSAYNETGGFENLPFSVTEDYLLMNAIASLKKYDVFFPADKDLLVSSKPAQKIKEVFAQKKRWGAGGLNGTNYSFLIILTAYFANLSVLMVPLFYSSVSLYLAVFKISADYFFLLPVYQKLGLKKSLWSFLLFELYYSVYLTVLPFLLIINKKISWKGREF